MTKEEAIEHMLEKVKTEHDPCETCGYVEGSPFCLQYCPYDAERKKEQESCDDAISREWLMRKATERFYTTNYFNHITKMIEEAPSVNPQPCNDAISRDDRLLDLANAIESDDSGYWTNKRISSALRNIEKLPSVTQKSGKWIPVSEPPKELGTYLIQTDGEPYMCQCRWTDVNPFWTDLKTKPHWNIFDIPQYSKVVAWMPLPKPYEPQERSE